MILSSTSRRAAQEGRSVGLPRPAVGGSGYPGTGRSVGLPRRDGRSEGGASPTPRCRHCRNGCPFAIVQCRHRLRTRHARRLVLTFHRLGVADRLTRAPTQPSTHELTVHVCTHRRTAVAMSCGSVHRPGGSGHLRLRLHTVTSRCLAARGRSDERERAVCAACVPVMSTNQYDLSGSRTRVYLRACK